MLEFVESLFAAEFGAVFPDRHASEAPNVVSI
jgi:hypothetical protein